MIYTASFGEAAVLVAGVHCTKLVCHLMLLHARPGLGRPGIVPSGSTVQLVMPGHLLLTPRLLLR